MFKDGELETLLADLESDRVERKSSIADTDKIREAICAFANDMPDHRKPGVVFVGVTNDGQCANLVVTDQLLLTLADMRSDGNILPIPTMLVQKRRLCNCDVAVVAVHPSDAPPVRFKGRIWIRAGPRRATASAEEERRLNEKRSAKDLPYDLHALSTAQLSDLDLSRFEHVYLPIAYSQDVIVANERNTVDRLTSLRFVAVPSPHNPTVVGMLVLGKTPSDFIDGAYVQFLRIGGPLLSDAILDQKEIHGPIDELLLRVDDLLHANIMVPTDIATSATEIRRPDYPIVALQQIIRNAVMHRDYATSNAPVRITWFNDRVEIQNPGGPFGQVTCDNFGQPGITDYRNPHLAEAMKTLGFVQRFGIGIATARKECAANGNPPPEFSSQPNHVLATIRRRV